MNNFGWKGRVLSVDLSRKTFDTINLSEKICRTFIGGRGISGYFLRPYAAHDWDNPESPLIFFTGPLCASGAYSSDKFSIMGKSPLTGTIADSSSAGEFGVKLKAAGYDGLIIKGKADSLSGLEINGPEVKFTSAHNFSGKKLSDFISDLSDKGSVAATGLAAENGVTFSNIIIDGKTASCRNGLGLLMSEKNLKYISINGSEKTSVHDYTALEKSSEDIMRLISASPFLAGEMGVVNFGSGALFDLVASRRMMPTDNFRKTFFEKYLSVNPASYERNFKVEKFCCPACKVGCSRFAEKVGAIPDYDTMSHFSALLNNSSIALVIKANGMCLDFGLDTISTAATIACYMEIEKRELSPEDILSIIKDIAFNKGIGRELGRGSYLYAKSKGKEELSMSVKGQELPAFDPRGAYGMTLSYAVSSKGGCYDNAGAIIHEILRKPVATDRFTFSGKARIIKIAEDFNAAVDSLAVCKMMFFATSLEEYAKSLNAVTGLDFTAGELMETGERICYNERIMNHAAGINPQSDTLPERFFTEEGSSGNGIEIKPIDRKSFCQAVANYYKVRGLDKDGQPVREKANKLGIEYNE